MYLKVTFYGWPDNEPPGDAIAYPTWHQTAGGTGAWEDQDEIEDGYFIPDANCANSDPTGRRWGSLH
jgi:hypothetical protein